METFSVYLSREIRYLIKGGKVKEQGKYVDLFLPYLLRESEMRRSGSYRKNKEDEGPQSLFKKVDEGRLRWMVVDGT